jgi:hypothetical protein
MRTNKKKQSTYTAPDEAFDLNADRTPNTTITEVHRFGLLLHL